MPHAFLCVPYDRNYPAASYLGTSPLCKPRFAKWEAKRSHHEVGIRFFARTSNARPYNRNAAKHSAARAKEVQTCRGDHWSSACSYYTIKSGDAYKPFTTQTAIYGRGSLPLFAPHDRNTYQTRRDRRPRRSFLCTRRNESGYRCNLSTAQTTIFGCSNVPPPDSAPSKGTPERKCSGVPHIWFLTRNYS